MRGHDHFVIGEGHLSLFSDCHRRPNSFRTRCVVPNARSVPSGADKGRTYFGGKAGIDGLAARNVLDGS